MSLGVVISVAMFIILCTFVLSLSRLLNCLIVVENLNVLLLLTSLLSNLDESRIFFVALMVIFTVEVILGLVVLTRIWDTSGLIGILAW